MTGECYQQFIGGAAGVAEGVTRTVPSLGAEAHSVVCYVAIVRYIVMVLPAEQSSLAQSLDQFMQRLEEVHQCWGSLGNCWVLLWIQVQLPSQNVVGLQQ